MWGLELHCACECLAALTKGEYRGLRHLITTATSTSATAFYSQTDVGLRLRTAIPVLVEDPKTRSTCVKQLLEDLTTDKHKIRVTVDVKYFVELLREQKWVSGALSMLQECINLHTKYTDTLHHESDLQKSLKKFRKQWSEWEELALSGFSEDANSAESTIRNYAISWKVPFHCVEFRNNVWTGISFSLTHLTTFLSNVELLEEVVRIVKADTNLSISLLAWNHLSKLIALSPQLQSRYYSFPSQNNDFSGRLVWLLCCVQKAQSRTSNKDLEVIWENTKIDFQPIACIRKFSYKIVAYYDLLVHAMSDFCWGSGIKNSLSDYRKLMSILTFVANCVALEEFPKGLKITLFDTGLKFFTPSFSKALNSLSAEEFDSDLPALVESALLQQVPAELKGSAGRFLLEMSRMSLEIAGVLLGNVINHIETLINQNQTPIALLPLCQDLLLRNEISLDPEFQEFNDRYLDFYLRESEFWALAESERSAVLGVLHALWKNLVKAQKEKVVRELVQWVLRFHEKRESGSRQTLSEILCFLTSPMDSDILEPALQTLNTFHRDLSWRSQSHPKWSYSCSDRNAKSALGIQNLGATCYMSAILQQLYHVPTFCDGVLSLSHSADTPVVNCVIDLFAALKYKGKGSVSPMHLCAEVGDVVASVNEQMDIEEFLNGVMPMLERQLADTSQPDLVRLHFTGRQLTTIKCSGCEVVRDNPQDFLTLPVGIRGKRDLESSLAAMVKGELMAGDNAFSCDHCGTLREAQSVHRIQSLPKVLIIQLRRFDYSIETKSRWKISDRFEFPDNIDMKPYCTSADFPEEYYQYRLRGVVIHAGSAESGHYYSLIRSGDNWMRFDDVLVTPAEESLGKVAFGRGLRQGFGSSAYLLLYERTQFFSDSPQPLLTPPPPSSQEVLQLSSRYQQKLARYWVLQQLLSKEYLEFVTGLVNTGGAAVAVLKFAVSYFLTVHVRDNNWAENPSLFTVIYEKVKISPKVSYWLCEVLTHPCVLDEFLVLKPPVSVQKCFILLLEAALRNSAEAVIYCTLKKLLYRLQFLSDAKAKSAIGLHELIFIATKISIAAGKKLQVSQRIANALFSKPTDLPPLAPLKYLFSAHEYLGYLPNDYIPCAQPAGAANFGFLLSVVEVMGIEGNVELALGIVEKATQIGQLFSSHFERKKLCCLLVLLYEKVREATIAILSTWIEQISISNEIDLQNFFDIVLNLAQMTDGALLSPVLKSLFHAYHYRPPIKYLLPKYVELLYSLNNLYPSADIWRDSISIALFRQWSDVVDPASDQFEILQLLCSQTFSGIASIKLNAAESFYGNTLAEGGNYQVQINGKKKVGRLYKTFGIVHILRLQSTNRLHWVAAEEDLKRN